MALEEQGQQSVWSFLKKMLRNFLRTATTVLLRPLVKRADKSVEKHQMHSLKALTRKNPNMGIYEKAELSATQAKLIGKELKKMQQDFFVEPSKNKEGKTVYTIYSTSNNKSLVDSLYNKNDERSKEIDSKPKLTDRLSSAREKANELNKANQQHKQRMAEKHKDISL